VARAQQASAAVRSRPEYEQFARTRDRLGRQAELTKAQERPRVWTFGKVAYGLPGLNFVVSEWEFYGFGGVRVEWKALTWGAAAREREALAIGQQIVAADQAAFDRGLLESTATERASIERLQHALTVDERIVALREQVARSTQIRLQEGVVTASEYLDRQAELLHARFARAGHEVELAQASARLLTTLGLEVQ
jgi:outer membrane protein TolC